MPKFVRPSKAARPAPYSRPTPTKKRRTSVAKVAKAVVEKALKRELETKESIYSATDGTEIFHNNFATLNSELLFTTQGVADPANSRANNRIGDKICLKGVTLKMMVELNERYSDVTFRLMVVKCARGDVPTRATLFVGQSGNKMLDTFNHERYSLLYQKWFKLTARNIGTFAVNHGVPNTGTSLLGGPGVDSISRATKIVKCWIPGKKFAKNGIIKYDENGTQQKFFDYHVQLYAYSNYSTAQDVYYVGRVNDFISMLKYTDA